MEKDSEFTKLDKKVSKQIFDDASRTLPNLKVYNKRSEQEKLVNLLRKFVNIDSSGIGYT